MGCAPGDAPKPDLPASVSPGWKLRKMEASGAPDRLPTGSPAPVCWRADYVSEGEATVWACGYRASGSAFEAVQRMRPAASEVRFQKGRYLIVVQWKNVTQASITVLVGAIQRTLPSE